MAGLDEQIGRNVLRARGDMSQRELAGKMREAGWPKWSHLTVASIERGERPLRLSESLDLQRILGATWGFALQDADAEAREYLRRLYEDGQRFQEATSSFLSNFEMVRIMAKNAVDISEETRADASTMTEVEPAELFREEVERWESESESGATTATPIDMWKHFYGEH